ncbi:serine/threonine protein kinase [Massilia sp. CF038]|nr:serine/threonine protein kinase [Massilia sp. CF038]
MKKPERVGPYTLISLLGDRARSRTWLASAGEGPTREQVALKLARPKEILIRARILHAVQLAAGFNHPNIVRMYECAEADGVLWLASGYVHGQGHRLTLANFRQLLLALVHVHANGVIHADLRSENLLLDEEGDLHLANFTHARRQGEPGMPPQSALGNMAPEQLRGEPLDVRADLFAAGAVLYQILTGAAPFEGRAATSMPQLRDASQAAPSAVSPGLGSSFDALISQALARDRAQRFGSAFEFLSAFDSACKRGVRPVR